MNLPALIERLRELEGKATKGPWENCYYGGQCRKDHQHNVKDCHYELFKVEKEEIVSGAGKFELIGWNDYGPILSKENALFIAQSRNALPDLLDALSEAVSLLEFYSKGGHPAMDMVEHKELGFFTGKRANEFLKRWGLNPEGEGK